MTRKLFREKQSFMERTNIMFTDFEGVTNKMKAPDGKMLQCVYRIWPCRLDSSRGSAWCWIYPFFIKDAHAGSVLNLTRESKLQGHLCTEHFLGSQHTKTGMLLRCSLYPYSSFFILSYIVVCKGRARFGASEAETYLGPY